MTGQPASQTSVNLSTEGEEGGEWAMQEVKGGKVKGGDDRGEEET